MFSRRPVLSLVRSMALSSAWRWGSGMPSTSPSMVIFTFFSSSSSISELKYFNSSPISAATSSFERDQFSVEKA